VLPRGGSILDFFSSWISHYPAEVEAAQKSGALHIIGTGMNKSELSQNPTLTKWTTPDLNEDPNVKLPQDHGQVTLDTSTCVVSIDYLTQPVEVLQSIRKQTKEGGEVHLVISNRCFPTKVVGSLAENLQGGTIRNGWRLPMVEWMAGYRDCYCRQSNLDERSATGCKRRKC
jgi:hypothetical protein